jgi:hypothetical protein
VSGMVVVRTVVSLQSRLLPGGYRLDLGGLGSDVLRATCCSMIVGGYAGQDSAWCGYLHGPDRLGTAQRGMAVIALGYRRRLSSPSGVNLMIESEARP